MASAILSHLFAAPAERWWDLAQAVLMGVAGSWIALLFHELGHAGAAWLVGVRIWGIRLGTGPAVWRGSIGQRQVQVAGEELRPAGAPHQAGHGTPFNRLDPWVAASLFARGDADREM